MVNQSKYVLKGALFVIITILVFNFVKIIAGMHFSEAPATIIESQSEIPIEKVPSLQGQKLFSENCATCHVINKSMVGPALYNFEKRGPWKNRKQLYSWIHNPSAYMKHDKYTQNLFREYNEIMMTSFPNLSDSDIDAIVIYMQRSQNIVSLPTP